MPTILIADDDKKLCQVLESRLKKAGFSVMVVHDGADAILGVVEQNIDLVILDMLMPGFDGIKAIRVLKKITPQIPIIGLTGFVGEGYMAQAMKYGVTIFSKPIEFATLLDKINHSLNANTGLK